MFNPYEVRLDFGDRKRKFITDRLAAAGFVVLASCKEGIVIVTTNNKIELRKKTFEIHYKMAGARIGEINALNKLGELIMNAADGLHMNEALPDVNALAKVLSNYFSELFNGNPQPIIFKFMLAEVGPSPDKDVFVELKCDGFVNNYKQYCVLGDTYKESPAGKQAEPLSAEELKAANDNTKMIVKIKEGLKEMFAARTASGELVEVKDILRLVCGVWGEGPKIEAVVLSREPVEGDERHLVRLSKEEIQEKIK
jgi:hypothetical protein